MAQLKRHGLFTGLLALSVLAIGLVIAMGGSSYAKGGEASSPPAAHPSDVAP